MIRLTARSVQSPEEIAAQAGGEIPFLRLPQRQSVFMARAQRLRQLAQGHPMAGYLEFIATLAEAQQRCLDAPPVLRTPAAAELQQCRSHGMPPLNAQTLPRDPAWRDLLRGLLRELSARTGGAVQATLQALAAESDTVLEAQADKLLHGIGFGLDAAYAPLIGAALQVCWTHLATTLGEAAFARIDVPNVCPCCGAQPVASIARSGARESGHRFLHCSLCAAEWHMVRIKCAGCDSTRGISYRSIEDGRPGDQHAVKAECCEECGSYLKILYVERDPQVEPVADDLASLPLDLLMAETGTNCLGVNFMLAHGDPAGAGAPA